MACSCIVRRLYLIHTTSENTLKTATIHLIAGFAGLDLEYPAAGINKSEEEPAWSANRISTI